MRVGGRGGETRLYGLVPGGQGRMRRQGGSTRTAPLADRPGRPAEPLASPTASIRCLGRRLQGRSREGSENGSAKVAGRLRAADGGSPPGARGRRAQTGSAARKHRPGHGVVRTAQGVTKARGAAAGRRPGASHGCVCVRVCACVVHLLCTPSSPRNAVQGAVAPRCLFGASKRCRSCASRA